MDTTTDKQSKEQLMKELGLTEEDFVKIGKDLNDARKECVESSIVTLTKEVGWLEDLLPILSDETAIPDELIVPMHNLFSIVPEEQHLFLRKIKNLYRQLPEEVRLNDATTKYIRKRLNEIKKDLVNTKIQVTDLSQYWAAYRGILYRIGLCDNEEQAKIQVSMRTLMLQITKQTINKRKKGIKSAKFLLEHS